MPKIRMLRGLPGSGKTTLAREIVEDGNWGRVNRDDLRAMIFNGKWSGRREEIIIAAEKAIAQVLLEHGHGAMIDASPVGSLPARPFEALLAWGVFLFGPSRAPKIFPNIRVENLHCQTP